MSTISQRNSEVLVSLSLMSQPTVIVVDGAGQEPFFLMQNTSVNQPLPGESLDGVTLIPASVVTVSTSTDPSVRGELQLYS